MNIKRLLVGLIVAHGFQFIAFDANAEEGLNDLTERALSENRNLQALEKEVTSLQRGVDAAPMWMFPMLGVEYDNFAWNSWSLTGSPMTGVQVMVEQTFPFPGKNKRREETAIARVKVKEWQLQELKVELNGLIKKKYYDLYLTRQLKGVIQENIALVEQLEDAVRAKYAVGEAEQKELISLEVQKEKMGDEIHDLEQREKEITAMLNASLHRDVKTEIATPAEIALQLPKSSSTELLEEAINNRPLLKELVAESSSMRLAAEEEYYERMPDITFKAGWHARAASSMDDGTDLVTLGVSIPLPLDYTKRFSAKQAQMLEAANAADQEYSATVDEISASIEKQLSFWRRSAEKAVLYEERLIPKTQSALDSFLSSYKTGKGDYASLFDTIMQLVEYEKEIHILKVRAATSKVALEMLTGKEIQKESAKEQTNESNN